MIMIQQFFNGMLTLMLAKFMLNDVPHAAGIPGAGTIQQLLSERDQGIAGWGKPLSRTDPAVSPGQWRKMYHLTPWENWPDIERTGLAPSSALSGGEVEAGAGTYLALTESFLRSNIDIFLYMYPVTEWALLEVSVHPGITLYPDPESRASKRGLYYAFIAKKPIPPEHIRLLDKIIVPEEELPDEELPFSQ